MPISEDKAKQFMQGYSVFGPGRDESPEAKDKKPARERIADKIAGLSKPGVLKKEM